MLATTFPPWIVTVADPPFVNVSIPTAELPVPPETEPLILRVISPAPSASALIPAPVVDALAVTEPEVVINILPAPELVATMASPLCPVIVPFVDMDVLPVPAFSTRIPLVDPVTAFAVMVIAVPLATVFLTNIP